MHKCVGQEDPSRPERWQLIQSVVEEPLLAV
jgi:hypothetical protein